MRTPSVKSLIQNDLSDTREQAEEVREALWNDKLTLANRLMGTWGLECIPWPANAFSECITPNHELEYFNAGDPYVPTLVRIDKGSWFVKGYGDVFEACLRRFGKGGHE